MAEAIGLAASIIAIIQIADQVASFCKFCMESMHDCPRDLRLILVELSTTKTVFESLEFVNKVDPVPSAVMKALAGPNGPILGCLKSVKDLESLMASGYLGTEQDGKNESVKRSKRKIALAALAWPFKKEKARVLLSEISHYKVTITAALAVDA